MPPEPCPWRSSHPPCQQSRASSAARVFVGHTTKKNQVNKPRLPALTSRQALFCRHLSSRLTCLRNRSRHEAWAITLVFLFLLSSSPPLRAPYFRHQACRFNLPSIRWPSPSFQWFLARATRPPSFSLHTKRWRVRAGIMQTRHWRAL